MTSMVAERLVGREPEWVTEERLARLAVVCGHRNALDAELVELTGGQLDAGIGGQGFVTLGHWVAHRTGMSSGTAARVVRIAERRRELPVSYRTFREGRLSLDQMYAIARRVPAGFDEAACELAVMCTPAQLDRLFKRYPWPEPADSERARPSGKARDTTVHFDDDGDLWLKACLPAEQGVVVDTALRAHYDALMQDWLAGRTAADKTGEAFGTPKPSWSDALERMALRSLEAEAADRPASRWVQTIVHVDLDKLVAQVHLGPALSDAVRRCLTCDSTFRVLYERAGVALGVGRQSRDIPDRTRLAVEHRDGGCRVPGCTARVVQIHHVEHWEDGGPTETANLIAVCPAHHRMHHRGELGIEGTNADQPGGIRFLTASGCPLGGVRTPRPPLAGEPPPVQGHYEHPLGERLHTELITFGQPANPN